MTNTNGAAIYSVEKGFPLPAPAAGRKRVYAFGTMEVGDSFALIHNDAAEVERVRASASYFGIRNPPKKFAVRLIERGAKEYRCWRIA